MSRQEEGSIKTGESQRKWEKEHKYKYSTLTRILNKDIAFS